jgi:hypothetical protein
MRARPAAEGVAAVISDATTRQCKLELEALPDRIQQVRRIVAAKLRYWRLDPLVDATLLGITELLANVHRHAEPHKKCSVELNLSSGWLTAAVSDGDPRLPRVREFEPLATCGRGLAMVVSMSDSWGTDALPGGGKVVWFTQRAQSTVAGHTAGLAEPLAATARLTAPALDVELPGPETEEAPGARTTAVPALA